MSSLSKEKVKSDSDIKPEPSPPSPSTKILTSPKSEDDPVAAGLMLVGGVTAVCWLIGVYTWLMSLEWAPNTKRNAMMIWGLGMMFFGLPYFVFEKMKSGRAYLLEAMWALLFGLTVGTWVV